MAKTKKTTETEVSETNTDKMSSECYTFEDKEKKFKLSVKTEFLKKCPDPTNHTSYDLNNKFYLFKFLHHPSAPAVIRYNWDGKTDETHGNIFTQDGHRLQYWIDGKLMDVEDAPLSKKMDHSYRFSGKLQEVINS